MKPRVILSELDNETRIALLEQSIMYIKESIKRIEDRLDFLKNYQEKNK